MVTYRTPLLRWACIPCRTLLVTPANPYFSMSSICENSITTTFVTYYVVLLVATLLSASIPRKMGNQSFGKPKFVKTFTVMSQFAFLKKCFFYSERVDLQLTSTKASGTWSVWLKIWAFCYVYQSTEVSRKFQEPF